MASNSKLPATNQDNRAVFPSSVSKSGTSPSSSVTINNEEYVLVKKPIPKTPPSSAPISGTSDYKTKSDKSDGCIIKVDGGVSEGSKPKAPAPDGNPYLDLLIKSNKTDIDILRLKIMEEAKASHDTTRSMRGDITYKHFYYRLGQVVSGDGVYTESGSPLNQVSQGDSYSQRLGNMIKMHRIVLEWFVWFHHKAGTTTPEAAANPPSSVILGMLNEVIPSTPGTSVSMAISGSNPPVAQALYNNLGIALGLDNNFVKSPLCDGIFESMKFERVPPNRGEVSANGANSFSRTIGTIIGTDVFSQDQVYRVVWDIPLHGRKVLYVPGSNSPLMNQLSTSFLPSCQTNSVVTYGFTSDLTFEDITTM